MTSLQAIAERLAGGRALAGEDAAAILDARDLIEVGVLADGVRRQRHGTATTFVRVLEVHAGAIPPARAPGTAAGEIRIVGRPDTLDAARAAVAAARRLAGRTTLSGFSLADLAALDAAAPGAFGTLAEAGLDAVAELPIDELSGSGSDAAGLVHRARAAGLLVQRVTVRAVAADPVALVMAVADLQRAAGGLQAFAPLPRSFPAAEPTTGYDDVKLVALARLAVREVPSIQVDWPLYGPKLAQVALTMGADDVDGVAAVEAGTLGPRRSALEEIRTNIRAAGLQPIERNGAYARLD